MKWGTWTSSLHRNPGETFRFQALHRAVLGKTAPGGGWGSPRRDGEGGWGAAAAAHALLQREPASRMRAETPGDARPAGPEAQASFSWANGCLPCSSEGISPSPVCPASLLTLLFPSRRSGECGWGSFRAFVSANAGFSGLPPCPLLGAKPPFWWAHPGAGAERG